MNNQIGINSNGNWTAQQYVIDAGWDYTCVEATAEKGVSETDAEELTEAQSSELLEFCKGRVEEKQAESIDEACKKIGASKANDGNGYIYRADEVDEWYRVSGKELIDLADLMHSTDEDVARDAYSHWCNGSGELIGDDNATRAAGLIE